jgi:hypothetical protein
MNAAFFRTSPCASELVATLELAGERKTAIAAWEKLQLNCRNVQSRMMGACGPSTGVWSTLGAKQA